MRIPEWLVTAETFPGCMWRKSARTAGQARYAAYIDATDVCPDLTFRKWLQISRVTRAGTPPCPDGYDYIRRRYPDCYSPKIGERVTGEGITGTVIYPGETTCYVHVLPEGQNHHVVMHPAYVSPTP